MSKEKFNWKGLFINEEGSNEGNKTKSSDTKQPKETKFPKSTTTSFPSNTVSSGSVNNAVLEKILEMYETGFDSLNKSGYDFYEFFKAIKAVNSSDPSMYKMALTMAQGVDPKVTKTSLIADAGFYIQEIEKVHSNYKKQGTAKRNQILSKEKTKKTTLSAEIATLEKQLLQIQTDISNKKNQLEAVDGNILSSTSDIDQKIAANDMAKDTILKNITNVAEGIKNNL